MNKVVCITMNYSRRPYESRNGITTGRNAWGISHRLHPAFWRAASHGGKSKPEIWDFTNHCYSLENPLVQRGFATFGGVASRDSTLEDLMSLTREQKDATNAVIVLMKSPAHMPFKGYFEDRVHFYRVNSLGYEKWIHLAFSSLRFSYWDSSSPSTSDNFPQMPLCVSLRKPNINLKSDNSFLDPKHKTDNNHSFYWCMAYPKHKV